MTSLIEKSPQKYAQKWERGRFLLDGHRKKRIRAKFVLTRFGERDIYGSGGGGLKGVLILSGKAHFSQVLIIFFFQFFHG